jgi:hypothetical protein
MSSLNSITRLASTLTFFPSFVGLILGAKGAVVSVVEPATGVLLAGGVAGFAVATGILLAGGVAGFVVATGVLLAGGVAGFVVATGVLLAGGVAGFAVATGLLLTGGVAGFFVDIFTPELIKLIFQSITKKL